MHLFSPDPFSSEQIQSGAGVPPAISTATPNNLNQLTGISGGGPMRFAGSLDELGTVTVAGTPATVDSRTTNFVGYASASEGTNTVAVVATDYSGNSRTNNYQIVVTNNAVGKTLTYDLNGNLVSVVTVTSTNIYDWDAANRLTAVDSSTGVSPVTRSEFTYDGLGRRVKIVEKQNGSVVSTKKFLWCGQELCEERDSTGGTANKRFFRQGEQISGTNYFFTRDHLGSIREMTDSSGTLRARYEYDPYGRRTKVSGDLDAVFAFTGHFCHSVSGFDLTLYRAYDPDTGRWLNRDPIGERSGINLYNFNFNDPLNRIDTDGLDSYKLVGPFLVVYPSFWKFWRPSEKVYWGTPELYEKIIGKVNLEKAIEAAAVAALIAGMADSPFKKTPCPERDASGKVHGDLPKYVPKDWTKEDKESVAGELQESINRRKQEQQQLGEDGPHRRRIAEEEDLLRRLLRQLEDLR